MTPRALVRSDLAGCAQAARLCGSERVSLDGLPGSCLWRHLQVIAALRYAEKSQVVDLEAECGQEERGVRVGF